MRIHISTWQQYEDGNIPKGDILQRIHQEFNVNLNWLLTGRGGPYTELAGEQPIGYIADKGGLYSVEETIGKTHEGREFQITEHSRPGMVKEAVSRGQKGLSKKEDKRQKGHRADPVETLSREELALVRTLRLCGEEYKKRVYAAVSIRAKNVTDQKEPNKEENRKAKEDLEVLSLASIE